MREIRQSGSEGGGGHASPYPYLSLLRTHPYAVDDDDGSGHRCGLARGDGGLASCRCWWWATTGTCVDPGRCSLMLAGLARLPHQGCRLEP